MLARADLFDSPGSLGRFRPQVVEGMRVCSWQTLICSFVWMFWDLFFWWLAIACCLLLVLHGLQGRLCHLLFKGRLFQLHQRNIHPKHRAPLGA